MPIDHKLQLAGSINNVFSPVFKDYGVEFRDEVILLWSILNSRHDFRYLATPTFLCGFPVSFKATCQEIGAASPSSGFGDSFRGQVKIQLWRKLLLPSNPSLISIYP